MGKRGDQNCNGHTGRSEGSHVTRDLFLRTEGKGKSWMRKREKRSSM